MTIKEFIDKYSPGISKVEFFNICNSVSINIPNDYAETTNLENYQVMKLLAHNKINTHRINSTIIKDHNALLKKYDDTLLYYENLLARDPDHPENDKVLPEDRVGLEIIRNKLLVERNSYSKFITGITNRDISPRHNSLYQEYGANGSIIDNGIAQSIVDSQQKKIEKKDEKLSEKYAELDALEEELKLARTNGKKNSYIRKISKMRDKIAKINSKKGKIATKQRTIINRNASRLKKRVQENVTINLIEARREGEFVQKRVQTQKQIEDITFDYERSNSELEALKSSGKLTDAIKSIGKGFEARGLQRDSKKLERKLKALENKNGRCQFINQIQRDIHTHSFG